MQKRNILVLVVALIFLLTGTAWADEQVTLTKNNYDPLNLLLKAEEKLKKENSFVFMGKMKMNMAGTGQGFAEQKESVNIKASIHMQGIHKDPSNLYFKMQMLPTTTEKIVNKKNTSILDPFKMELLLKDNMLYLKENDNWYKQKEVVNNEKILVQQFNPELAKQILNDFNIKLNYEKEQLISGKKFIVIKGTLDGLDVIQLLQKNNLGVNNLLGSISPEELKLMQDLFENLRAEFYYYIDPDSLILRKETVSLSFSMNIKEAGQNVSINFNTNVEYDYFISKNIELPKIPQDKIVQFNKQT